MNRGTRWHALPGSEALRLLSADAERGLDSAEASRRLGECGRNRLAEQKNLTFLNVAWEELREPMILLLFSVAAAYALLGEYRDALVAFTITSLLVLSDVFTEFRAKHTVSQLHNLTAPVAAVIRDGRQQEVPAEQIVPGDVLILNAGNRVPADARLLWGAGLAVDESTLTGESVPVDKDAGAELDGDTPLGDRVAMVYAGTVVARGLGKAVVVATGMDTELGKIAGLARATREPRTPLQVHMRELTEWLLWVALGFSVLVPLLGVLVARQPWPRMLLTGLSLAFATIPEEAPILITMVLGLGSLRLYRRNAIVKRLRAAETLGSVTVIASDKTGTLTENRMEVARLWMVGGSRRFDPVAATPDERRLIEAGAACHSQAGALAGHQIDSLTDPMEAALARAAGAARPAGDDTGGDDRPGDGQPVETVFPFDSQRKIMSVVYRQGEALRALIKGAPEAVVARSCSIRTPEGNVPLDDSLRGEALAAAAGMAGDGLRVIAVAQKDIRGPVGYRPAPDEAESALALLGLVGLVDPPRPAARDSVAACQGAGVRVIMMTGDHPATALAVAREIGIAADAVLTGPDIERMDNGHLAGEVRRVSVFARISPEHKLRIVQALKAGGEIVAVTGDGANDAPALKEADIGVAMGRTGTDVAREAADLVIVDDDFATLAYSVREGRGIFANLQKAVRYYLAVKIALVGTMLIPILFGIPAPFNPVQIILLELFMDLAASAAFVSEEPEAGLMRRPPRRREEPFVDRGMKSGMLLGGGALLAAVTTAYLVYWSQPALQGRATTVAFATWMIAHVLLALVMRTDIDPLTGRTVFSNRIMTAWSLAALATVLLAVSVSWVQGVLKTTGLAARDLGLAFLVSVLAVGWLEGYKRIRSRTAA